MPVRSVSYRAAAFWAAGAVFVLLLPGCWAAKWAQQPNTVDDMSTTVEEMRAQQVQMAAQTKAAQETLAQQDALLRQYKAEDQARYDELKELLLAIDSKLQDALSRRPSSAPSWQNSGSASPWNSGSSATSIPMAGGAPPSAPPDSMGSGRDAVESENEAKRIYDQAYLDQTKGNYTLAILGFREYIRRNPTTDLADNAQYWVGEAFYAQRDFEQAIQEFLKVMDGYPKGDKIPAALLKTGYSFLQMGDKTSCKRYLDQLIEEFPNSEEATPAKNKLRSLE